jgi:hypothetical protein
MVCAAVARAAQPPTVSIGQMRMAPAKPTPRLGRDKESGTIFVSEDIASR